jgi:hypothetical protein
MFEFFILCVFVSVAWGYYTDWLMWKRDEARLEERVSLRRQYLSVASDSPSAWEAYGDALRRAGHTEEAIQAYEEALLLRYGKELPLEEAILLDMGLGKNPNMPDDTVLTPQPDPVDDGTHPPSLMAPLFLEGAVSSETGLVPVTMDAPAPLVPWETPSAVPAIPEEPLLPAVSPPQVIGISAPPVVATAIDQTGGTGLAHKLRLARMEWEETVDPERYGQTLRTRQPVCRACGTLGSNDDRDCRVCGTPLPVYNLLDTLHYAPIRREILTGAFWVFVQIMIIGVCIWFVGWLPGLVKFSVLIAAIIVIPLRFLQKIGEH